MTKLPEDRWLTNYRKAMCHPSPKETKKQEKSIEEFAERLAEILLMQVELEDNEEGLEIPVKTHP